MSRYIDADAFEAFGYNKTEGASEEYNDGFDDGVQYVLECIDNVPTADVRENVKGEWIDKSGAVTYPFWDRYTCSVCGKSADASPYCPNCGADMRGGNNDDQ